MLSLQLVRVTVLYTSLVTVVVPSVDCAGANVVYVRHLLSLHDVMVTVLCTVLVAVEVSHSVVRYVVTDVLTVVWHLSAEHSVTVTSVDEVSVLVTVMPPLDETGAEAAEDSGAAEPETAWDSCLEAMLDVA